MSNVTTTDAPTELPPVPTVEELARPFLLGIRALCEFVNDEACLDEPVVADEVAYARAVEVVATVRRTIDLVTGYAMSSSPSLGRGAAERGVRTALETIAEVAQFEWIDYQAAARIAGES